MAVRIDRRAKSKSGFRDTRTGQFTRGRGGATFFDTLTPGIAAYGVALVTHVHEVLEEMAREMEQYAKDNAPWNNRTGDARAGLKAEVDAHLTTPSLVLMHTIEYGVWLEIRWSGRYAIIMPTIEEFGPRVMERIGSSA